MRLPRALVSAACILAVATVLSSCGGGDSTDARAPDSAKIPTATLPAALPEPSIIGGGVVQPGDGTTYTIRSGDTLATIADRFGLSLEELTEANPGLDPAALSVGDAVQLPEVDGAPPVAEEPPPTEVPVEAAAATATSEPAPTEPPPPPPTNTPTSLGQSYIVQSGDIPVSIAAQFGITVEALIAANPGIDPTGLQVGDVLIIPAPPAGG